MSKNISALHKKGDPDQSVGIAPAAEEQKGGGKDKLEEFRRGFPILLTAIIGTGFGMASMSTMLLPLFLGPLNADFGWERSQILLAFSILTVMIFLCGPRAGRLADRVGAHRVIMASIVLFVIGMVLVSQVRGSIWWFYAAYLCIAAGGAGTTYVCYSRVLNTWFRKSRGLALGLMMSGPGLMAALSPLFIPAFISAHGWRTAWLMMAGAALIPLPFVLLFYRERQQAVSAQPVPLAGLSTKTVFRTRQFWCMLVATFLMAFSTVGTHMNFLSVLQESGIARPEGVKIMSVIGFSMLAGRFVCGTLLDVIFAPIVGVAINLIAAAGLLLAGSSAVSVYTAFAVGFVLGAEADFMAYVASRYFGLRCYSEIFGWIFGVMALGSACSPIWVSWLQRVTGSFQVGLVCSGVFLLIAAASISLLGRYPKTFEDGL